MWIPHLPVGQFYHVGFDMQEPFNVCGGLQDNDSWCGPSATRSQYGIANDQWQTVVGGDGFVSLIDPTNHRIIFSESQDGFMGRIDKVTNDFKSIRPEAPASEKPYRWNWDTPMMVSQTDPATIYVGANKLFDQRRPDNRTRSRHGGADGSEGEGHHDCQERWRR
jgi:hypothetical protein